MLHLLRILFLVVVAGVLVDAVVRISTGTTGTIEKSAVAGVACLWLVAAWRELRHLGLSLRAQAH
jgi:hypothetical protein